jgi:hypothetical protein
MIHYYSYLHRSTLDIMESITFVSTFAACPRPNDSNRELLLKQKF